MFMPEMTDAAGMAMISQTILYLYQGRIWAFIRVFYMFSRKGAKFAKIKIYFLSQGRRERRGFLDVFLFFGEPVDCACNAFPHQVFTEIHQIA